PIVLHLNFDKFPATKDRTQRFVGHIMNLQRLKEFAQRGISIDRQDIAEMDSKLHPVLQCLDIVLGCMQGKLNNEFLKKIPGERLRPKKTRAKEQVYK